MYSKVVKLIAENFHSDQEEIRFQQGRKFVIFGV